MSDLDEELGSTEVDRGRGRLVALRVAPRDRQDAAASLGFGHPGR